jgi:AraC-like DNA-binding protein
VCSSDLEWFSEKYPFITSLLFACEAMQESDKPYPTYHHKQLKGMLIAVLFYISNHKNHGGDFQNTIIIGAERIVDILIDHFDIVYYYNPDLRMKTELMERNRNMMVYFQTHYTEKITLDAVANEFNLTKAYISEFLRTYEIGFRKSLSYIRANKSEKLLLVTDMNIMDISEACGFSDPKYYYYAFKEWYKCTPRQFRQIYRNRMSVDGSERELSINEVIEPLNEMIFNHYLDLFLY